MSGLQSGVDDLYESGPSGANGTSSHAPSRATSQVPQAQGEHADPAAQQQQQPATSVRADAPPPPSPSRPPAYPLVRTMSTTIWLTHTVTSTPSASPSPSCPRCPSVRGR